MKAIKFLICNLIIFISFSLWSKTPVSEIQKPTSDNGEDYIVIYEYFVGPDPLANSGYDRTKQFLNKTLLLFDNAELKGIPTFTISPQDLKHEGVQYTFKDSFIGKCRPECDKYKFIPIDFIRVYFNNVSIAVKDYKEGVARVEHKNKSYYFKLDLNDSREYSWRNYKDRENIKKILESDSSYESFISDIKKCIAKKDLKCLEAFLYSDNIDIEEIENEIRKRAIYDNEALCDKFLDIRSSKGLSMSEVPKEMLNRITNLDLIWPKLDQIITYEGKDKFSNLEIRKFGGSKRYELQKTLANNYCGSWLDIGVTFLKKENKWKIISFRMSAFQH